MSRLPINVRDILNKVSETSPSDLQLLAERLHDHALDERMPAETLRDCVVGLGFEGIAEFCAAAGIPDHVARRWQRFGVSSEMRAVLLFMLAEKKRAEQAVREFETVTHVGLIDFLQGRGVLRKAQ
ncbi:MAG: hypothetical protein J0H18_01525 [Rhizobiales bacterium]|nr:hypothetical protein [Hyphomicrobiales bacterium]